MAEVRSVEAPIEVPQGYIGVPGNKSAGSPADAARMPPQAVESEQSVLGGLMLDNEAWDRIADVLNENDFYRREHRLIFRAISALSQEGQPADVVTVGEWLENAGELEHAGGFVYLNTLAAQTPGAANILAYAGNVRDRAVLRALIRAASSIGTSAFQPEGRSAPEILDQAERTILDISEATARRRGGFQPIKSLLSAAVDRLDTLSKSENAITGLPTGFHDLDAMTSGLQPGDLVIVAGRPSMGKCLSHDAELVLDDGSIATIEEIFRHGRGRPVGTLGDDFRLGRATPSDYVDDGIKPVYEVSTRLGRRIETTLPHPFLTVTGWKPLHELKEGDAIAVPRMLPVFGNDRMRECEVKLLAYLIGDGGLTGNKVQFTNSNPRIAAEFQTAIEDFGGLRIRQTEFRDGFAPSWRVRADEDDVREARGEFASRFTQALATYPHAARGLARKLGVAPATITYWKQGRSIPGDAAFNRLCEVLEVESANLMPAGLSGARKNGPNALVRWLTDLGLMGHGAASKQIPASVFRLERAQIAMFLNRLFATDGWATVLKSGQAQLGYSTVNERLARQVQHLLLRFGIIAALRLRWIKYRDARRPAWQLDITHSDSILAFAREIGIFGKEEAMAAVVRAVSARRRQSNRDLVPAEVWSLLDIAKGPMSWPALARRAGVSDSNIHAGKRALSRARLGKFAMALGDRHLLALSTSDVYWDRIVSIVPAGEKQVYDLTIPDTHNFIANDVCVHNTSLAMNMAENVALGARRPVAVFSMEMPAEQLALRMLASLGRINAHKVRTGRLDEDDWPRITSAIGILADAPLYVDDTPALTPLELRSRARRLKREHGDLGLIVLDYLQLMQAPESQENRATEVSNITRALKSLAKELHVPVVALSQLNRSLESRPNKRPVMSDLRESGAIEQDADVIFFIYRDEVYNEDSPDKGKAEIIIGKQRNGPTGKVPLTFLGEYTRFESYIEGGYDSRR